jgi:histidinol-phosphatase
VTRPAGKRRAAPVALDEKAIAEYVAFACRLGELAGAAILPHFRAATEVHNKAAAGAFDPVTIADRAAETAIRKEIARVYPTHGVFGEEHGRLAGTDRFTWVLDPIDGTRAFILGQLHWGTLIALNDGVRPIVGVMHQPFVRETFVGWPRGAELRRGRDAKPLRTRKCARLGDASVCATHPNMFGRPDERAAFQMIASKSRLVRYGGDCYSYCLLAAGFVDLVIESGLQPYDVQALVPIIQSAGGVITDWSGAPAYQGGQVIAAGDPELHRVALEVLSWART